MVHTTEQFEKIKRVYNKYTYFLCAKCNLDTKLVERPIAYEDVMLCDMTCYKAYIAEKGSKNV